jgi:hypothetical protein
MIPFTVTKISNMVILIEAMEVTMVGVDELELHWQERVKGLLKSELKRRGVGYKQLAEKLGEIGIHETDRNIANKLARGGFSAVFLVQCLDAIGCDVIRLAG